MKVVVITGASAGVGRATARAFAAPAPQFRWIRSHMPRKAQLFGTIFEPDPRAGGRRARAARHRLVPSAIARRTARSDVFSRAMRNEDIVAYAQRDWASIAAAKERYWAERKSSMTPAEALRLGDTLRADAEALRPGGAALAERNEDLACHARVGESLRRVRTSRRR